MVVLAGCAALLSYGAALPAPGVSVDSGEYLAVAEGLTDGHGLTMPYVNYDEPWQIVEPGERVTMAQFPPLYPVALAALQEASSLSALDGVRLLGACAYFLFVLVAEILLFRATRRLLWTALAGALLVAPDLVTVHAMAWSEPLMLLGLIGLVACLVRHLETGRWSWLAAAGLCGAGASLARFAGIALVVGAGIVLTLSPAPGGKRAVKAALFTLVSLLPVAGWFVRNALVVGTASEKTPGAYPPSIDDLEQFLETIGNWFVPGDPVGLIIGGLVVLAALRFGRRAVGSLFREDGDLVARTCVIVGLTYLAFVLVSKVGLDRNIPLDPRMLAPVQVMAALAVCCAFASAPAGMRWLGVTVVGAVALLTVYRASYTAWEFTSLNVTSYTNDHWRKSPTLRHVGAIPEDTVLISNAPDPIWLWHDRTAHLIPSRVNLYSGRRNMRYRKQVTAMLEATRCRNALVVFFSKPTRKPPREIDKEVRAQLDLQEIENFRDGEIYEVTEPDCA